MSQLREKFKEEVFSDEVVFAVGAYDALSAKIAEKVGFKCLICGGYPFSASILGKPDKGLLTMTEMVRSIKYIVDATNLPVIADADTGYGSSLNVKRTINELEKAGVAAIFLEDQVFPKRCGHMEGKKVIPAIDHVQKIKAAVDARKDDDMIIIARTDSRSIYGIDDSIKRAQMYAEAGADATFVEAPISIEEMEKITNEIEVPQVANMIKGGKTPFLSIQELEKMNFKIAFYTLGVQYAVAKSLWDYMDFLKTNGTSVGYKDMFEFDEFNEIIDLKEVLKEEKKYSIE